jgi:hypothetical protein
MDVVRDQTTGRVKQLLLFEAELCDRLDVTAVELRQWPELFKPSGSAVHPDRETREPVFRVTLEQLDRYQKYVKILKTGMTPKQILGLEERDSKAAEQGKKSTFLDMYALLAEECPPGITAHVLRTYCVLFLYQNRGKKMLLAKDLAKVAGIPEETAKRHLRWLQRAIDPQSSDGDRLLQFADNPRRWEFSFVPKALSRYYS